MGKLEIIVKRRRLRTLYVEPHAHLEVFSRNLSYEKVPGSAELGGYHLIKMMKDCSFGGAYDLFKEV